MIYKGFRVVVTVELEPTSATSMVVTPHCGDHSLSVEKAADEIPSTGGHRRLSPIDVFTSPAIVDQKPCCNHKKIPTREGWIFFCGDSWTRTNDPIDVNDVLYRLSHATLLPLKFLAARTVN